MAEFPTEMTVGIARRLDVRGTNSSSWLAVLAPTADPLRALEGLRDDLTSVLETDARVLSLTDSTFGGLRDALHNPSDDTIILVSEGNLPSEKWASLDLMRSALERLGPIVLWLRADDFAALSVSAPNIRSFVGPSVFAIGPDGSIMTEQERMKRLGELTDHYKMNADEVIRKAEARQLPSEPQFIEWLVLLGRGDLV